MTMPNVLTSPDYDDANAWAGAGPKQSMKTCTRCGETKPVDAFQRDKTHNDGRRSRCKSCSAEIDALRHAASPERKRRNASAWYWTHRERALSDGAMRAAANPEAVKERSRLWRIMNPERFRATKRAWALAHPEMVAAASRRRKIAHPDRVKARNLVQCEVNAGRLPRANTVVCEVCGEALACHWHHHNGYDPEHALDVVAVCIDCHTKEHRNDAHA